MDEIGRVKSAVPHKDLPFMPLRDVNQVPRIVAKGFNLNFRKLERERNLV